MYEEVMGSLFQHRERLPKHIAASLLEETTGDCRRRAAECRELAKSCCTEEAAEILSDLAVQYEERATWLGERRSTPIGSGRY